MKIFGTDFSDRETNEADYAWMVRMANEIHGHLPRMLRENSQRRDFWNWFNGEAESLFRYVHHDEERLYFQDCINKTLEDAGLEERFELTRRAEEPTRAQRRTPNAGGRSSAPPSTPSPR